MTAMSPTTLGVLSIKIERAPSHTWWRPVRARATRGSSGRSASPLRAVLAALAPPLR